MRAYEILGEQSPRAWKFRSQATNWQALAQALPKVEIAIKQFHAGNRIFRGVARKDNDVIYNPRMPAGTRSSANTQNYYTLFIDHNTKWKKFPPRGASIIASNSPDISRGYGTNYLVLPEGDPLIGICPDKDFWWSFRNRLHEVDPNSEVSELWQLNSQILYIIRKWIDTTPTEYTSWKQFQKVLQQIDSVNSYSFPQLPEKSLDKDYAGWAQALLSFHPGTTMEQKLDYLLDPQANGFKLTKLSAYNLPEGSEHEVWLKGNSWMVNIASLPISWKEPGFNLTKFIQSMASMGASDEST